MNIRIFHPKDLDQIEKIHKKFYQNEFSLADFEDPSVFKGVVVDDKDNVVTAMSIRAIAEIIAITDKDASPRSRRRALLDIMQCAEYVCKTSRFNQLHAFIQDESWLHHLEDFGFKQCKGKALYINI